MTALLSPRAIEAAYLAATRAELTALKPGNVHTFAPGHNMQVWQFEKSAEASVPWIADPELGVGSRILGGMEASFAVAGCNTNLGILLLAAPLARAADGCIEGADLRARLRCVLAGLDLDDARAAFKAIALANPGGLGKVDVEDVGHPPGVGLLEAMRLAAGRDRIARAYVTDLEDVFGTALPILAEARARGASAGFDVTTLHMALLATFPDSHIARKHGLETASAVMAAAEARRAAWFPVAEPKSIPDLLEFDQYLKNRGINPGTTADFVVATLFADELMARIDAPIAS